ncbi:hypothetical protein [Roseateles asaccharophilus]|uniref:hypothetical protein n=1 Tax=Roseateles asaccharophilus TaxID=582607 RepID=UPI003850DF66
MFAVPIHPLTDDPARGANASADFLGLVKTGHPAIGCCAGLLTISPSCQAHPPAPRSMAEPAATPVAVTVRSM